MAQLQRKQFKVYRTNIDKFQYRKRYGPVATREPKETIWQQKIMSFNTASGMAQLQQYLNCGNSKSPQSFNTASGMAQLQLKVIANGTADIDMFQYRKRYGPVATITGFDVMGISFQEFQYRKRYYPVATKYQFVYSLPKAKGFNTASGITQLQPWTPLFLLGVLVVACFNTASGITQLQQKYAEIFGAIMAEGFQYRKR